MSVPATRGSEYANGRNGRAEGGARRGGSSGSSLVDVLDHVLDKGVVIDAWVRISLLGLELLTIEARVVIASVDTYLKYAEAIGATALAAKPQPAAELGRGQASKQAEMQATAGHQQQFQPQQQQPQLQPQQQWQQMPQQMPQQQWQQFQPQQQPQQSGQMPQQQMQPQGASA